jgi:biopolymer transport protein ExbD
MGRFKTPETQEAVACNLIPMIDIMFLLLLFFMLGADMSQRDLADLVLPMADMVKEDPNLRGEAGRTTINIFHRPNGAGFLCPLFATRGRCRETNHWVIEIRGQEYTLDTVGAQLKEEGNLDLEEQVNPNAKRRLSKREVMIRADLFAPYGHIQRVIEFCGAAGIYKIEVGAAQPPKG